MRIPLKEFVLGSSRERLPMKERAVLSLTGTLPLRENLVPKLGDYPSIVHGQSEEFKSGIGDFSDLLLRLSEGGANASWLLQVHSGQLFFGEHPFAFFGRRKQEILPVVNRQAKLSGTPRDGSPLNVYPLSGGPVSVNGYLEAVLFSRDGDTITLSLPLSGTVAPMGLFFRLSDKLSEQMILESVSDPENYLIRSVKAFSYDPDVEFAVSSNGKSPVWVRAKGPDMSPKAMRRTYFLDDQNRLVLFNRIETNLAERIPLPDAGIDQVFTSAGKVNGVHANILLMDPPQEDGEHVDTPNIEIYYTLKDSYLYDAGELFFAQDQEWVMVEYEDAAEDNDLWATSLLDLNPIQNRIESGFVFMTPRDKVLVESDGGSLPQGAYTLKLTSESESIPLDGGRVRIFCEARDEYGSPLPMLSVEISSDDPAASFLDPEDPYALPAVSLVKETDAYGQFVVELVAPSATVARMGTLYGEAKYGEAQYKDGSGFTSEIGTLTIQGRSIEEGIDIEDRLSLSTYGDSSTRPRIDVRYGDSNQVQVAEDLPLWTWTLPSPEVTPAVRLGWQGGAVAVGDRLSNRIWLLPASDRAVWGKIENTLSQEFLSKTLCLAKDASDALWAGGPEGLSRHTPSSETHHAIGLSVVALAPANGKVFLGTDEGLVMSYDPVTTKLLKIGKIEGRISAMTVIGSKLYVGGSLPASLHTIEIASLEFDLGPAWMHMNVPGGDEVLRIEARGSQVLIETDLGLYPLGQGFVLGGSLVEWDLNGDALGIQRTEALRIGKPVSSTLAPEGVWTTHAGALTLHAQGPKPMIQTWIRVIATAMDHHDMRLNQQRVTLSAPGCYVLPAQELITGSLYLTHARGRVLESARVTNSKATLTKRWYVLTDASRSVTLYNDRQEVVSEIPGVTLTYAAMPSPNAMAVVHTFAEGQAVFYMASPMTGRKEAILSAPGLGISTPVIFEVN